jgi:Lar family restriction alleviation protein
MTPMNTNDNPERLSPAAGSVTLLPCPFCGGSNVLVTRPHGGQPVHYVAICTPEVKMIGCGASGTWMASREEAAAAWNQRRCQDTAILDWLEKHASRIGMRPEWEAITADGVAFEFTDFRKQVLAHLSSQNDKAQATDGA